jgi:alkyl hydroperoxide reductase subunit F
VRPGELRSAEWAELNLEGAEWNIPAAKMKMREPHLVPLEGVFVQIGLVPNTEWLQGTVDLAHGGEIAIDARCATSVPGVFAAGDATTVPFKQIVIAAGEGAKAALSAFDHLMRMPAPPAVAASAAAPEAAVVS